MNRSDMVYIASTLADILGDEWVKNIRELRVQEAPDGYAVSLTLHIPCQQQEMVMKPTAFLPEEEKPVKQQQPAIKIAKRVAAVPMTPEQIRAMLEGDDEE